LIAKFSNALTPEMIDYLVAATNTALKELHDAPPQDVQILEEERRRIGVELSNLVQFVIKGNASSPRLREEISLRERRLAELDQRLRHLRGAAAPARMQIDRTWVEAWIHRLSELLATDPAGARREIQKHIEDLRIVPAPEVGERVVRITGRAKSTASSESRRPRAYNWLRGPALNCGSD
jgi:hypothetical protein